MQYTKKTLESLAVPTLTWAQLDWSRRLDIKYLYTLEVCQIRLYCIRSSDIILVMFGCLFSCFLKSTVGIFHDWLKKLHRSAYSRFVILCPITISSGRADTVSYHWLTTTTVTRQTDVMHNGSVLTLAVDDRDDCPITISSGRADTVSYHWLTTTTVTRQTYNLH